MLEKTKIVHQTVRAAHGGDWHAILTLSELLRRYDQSQFHPAIPDTEQVFVAQDEDGHIVGMVCCHEPKDGVAPISNLFVLELYRGQGIGTALLQAAIAYIGPKTEIRLSVNRRNKQARRIYRRLGFKLSDNVDLKLVVAP